jgi:hypothetical protein
MVSKMMRAKKKVRQRRPMSPDQYQIVMQSVLRSMEGVAPAYHYHKSYSSRGDPSVYIVVLLGHGYQNTAAASAAVEYLYQELHEMMATLSIVVTFSDDTFWQCVRMNQGCMARRLLLKLGAAK